MRGSSARYPVRYPRPGLGWLGVAVVAASCNASVSNPNVGVGTGGMGTGLPGTGGTTTGTGTGSTTGTGTGATTGTGTGGAGAGTTVGGAGGTTVVSGTGGASVADACARSNGVLNVGLTPLRRLTRDQFNNTVRDLLGSTGQPADLLTPDERIGPFQSNAIAPITELLVQQQQEMAVALAAGAQTRMATLAPCDLAADTGTTCATRFVTEFGRRAYRRPLDAAEIQKYVTLFTLGRTGNGAANGFRVVVEAMLQSPFFLYHHDVGATGTPQPSPVAVTAYELASRLSYFLWNSMPDDPLFAVAANGTLSQDTVITAQVQRMLSDAKAGSTIALFHRQWLALEDLPARDKSAAVFPSFTPQLADAMMQETALFTDYVVRRGDGLLKTLLTSNVAFPQGGLFGLYGVAQPAGFTVGTSVTLNPAERAGILTQAAFLTRHAHADQTSPVHRGIVVRENVMCGSIPPPPANANTTPPPPSPATSTRQRFAQHVADAACAGCHTLMDPIGLGFENYDGIGAYRTMDGPGAVDASGQIGAAGADLVGPFNGAVELSNKLAQAKEVSDCVANQWFRFSMGRMESTNDACSIQAIRDAFRASGGNIRSLLAQIAASPAFRNVRTTGG